MKIIILIITITLLSSAFWCGAQQNVDSIYNSLTLESRLKLLFADTLQQNPAAGQLLKTNSVVKINGNGNVNHNKGSNGFSLLLNANQALNSTGRIPSPDIRNISDSSVVAAYFSYLVAMHHKEGVHGIYTTKGEKSYALFINPGNRNELVHYQISPFPDQLNRLHSTTNSPNHSTIRMDENHIGESSPNPSLESLLESRHLFFGNNMGKHIGMMERAIKQKLIDESLFEKRIKEIISIQNTSTDGSVSPNKSADYWNFELYKKSIICLSRQFEPIVDFSNTEIGLHNNQTAKQYNLLGLLKRYTDHVVPAHPSVLANAAFMKYFVVAAQSPEEVTEAAMAIKDINRPFNNQIILLYTGDWHDDLFKDPLIQQFTTLIMGHGPANLIFDLQTQALLGGIEVNRYAGTPDFLKVAGFHPIALDKTRLGYVPAENAGMDAMKLSQIDAIMAEMIKLKAAPGGQVLVARNGEVVYNHSFGKESYIKGNPIEQESIYDLASVTKVMGTTPLMMMLYDSAAIDNNTRLGDVLPAAQNTNKSDITIQELLLHQAGLPAFIPFYLHALDSAKINKPLYSKRLSKEYPIRVDTRLFMMANPPYKETVFRPQHDTVFNIRVSENLFMNRRFKEEMLRKIYSEPLRKKEYRYSDLSMYLAQQVVEHKLGQPENILFDHYFSQPLGAQRLTFLPLEKFKPQEIVPTENDLAFRKELLRGYVHDPGAAMMGGVAGHAGLFANSNDLAKMAQMLLNKGSYGGKQYINPNTVDHFTRQQIEENRRALGFDKPEPDKTKSGPCSDQATPSSYGHSGFTGTFIWIDPDKNLIYIFLSNRVHPYAFNKKLIDLGFRKKIQDVIYNAITE